MTKFRIFRWALAAALLSPAAFATSDPFRAARILNHPARPDTLVAFSNSWGFIRSTDAGRTWEWSCSEVFGSRSVNVDAPRVLLTGGGRLLVANGFRGLHFTDDFCTWTQTEGLQDQLVAEVASRGNTVVVLTSTGANGGIDNRLWASADEGGHLDPLAADLPADVVIHSLAFAPSRPERAYALGFVLGGSEGVLLRSDDGGQTFQRFSAPGTVQQRASLRLAAVHPSDPDIVFEHIDVSPTVDDADELWVTSDGGENWRRVFAAQGDLPGFALSPDASQLAIAGPRDGVYRGALSAILQAEPGGLAQVNPRSTWGLLWNQRGLYGGNDNFGPRDHPEPYTLGLSHDEGATFEDVAEVCAFRFSACAAGTQGHDLCQELWSGSGPEPRDFTNTFQLASGRCVTDASAAPPPAKGTDASAPSPVPPASPPDGGEGSGASRPDGGGASGGERIIGGCGCALTTSAGGAHRWLLLFGVVLALRRRRATDPCRQGPRSATVGSGRRFAPWRLVPHVFSLCWLPARAGPLHPRTPAIAPPPRTRSPQRAQSPWPQLRQSPPPRRTSRPSSLASRKH